MDHETERETLAAKNRELEVRCRALQETVRMQGRFADIATILSSDVELPKITATFLDKMLSETRLSAGAFFLKDEDGTFTLFDSHGLEARGDGFDRIRELTGEAARTRDLVTGNGAAGILIPRRDPAGGTVPAAMTAAFPCVYENNVNCVLVAAAGEPISIDILSFISALTPNLALTVNNALSYDKIKRTTAELTSERTRLNAVMYNMADGLLVTDTEGVIIRANRALLDMFGYGKVDLAGKKTGEVFAPAMDGLIEQARQIRGRDAVSLELGLPGGKTAKALSTPISVATSPDARTAGDRAPGFTCSGVVTIIRDITKEKEVDRMKTDFISTVSHELRTPLTSVLGFARIIKKKMQEVILPRIASDDKKVMKTVQQVADNLDIIVSEGERLTLLINDVLDLAKMEAGKIDWKMEPLSVEELVKRAAAAMGSLFEQKGLALIVEVDPSLPKVTGDRDRLIQTVINLLSNALKFTETGSVTCRAQLRGDTISVSVIDTGIGIGEENREKVFEKFQQLGDTLIDKPRGTGLGLPICRQIIEHLGGKIWVEGATGGGSAFIFTLPVAGEEAAVKKRVDMETLLDQLKQHVGALGPAPAGTKTILVVDDDENIRRLLRQELESGPYRVIEAADGVAAVKQAKAERPDLIILDVMMPGISGFDAAAVLKNDPDTRKIPIIILSIVDDKDRGYRIGIDRYLTKPVDTDELLKSVGDLLARGASRKKVFVVDEDASLVRSLSGVLDAQGYQVVGVCTGAECIEKARIEKPDMIIVDALFSKRHEIVKTLRFEKGLRNVYFVILGGQSSDTSVIAAGP